ncbi:MAG: LamG-like jellyroll fold domain-containing protein [Candidatus Zixiibacteriota bacterium]
MKKQIKLSATIGLVLLLSAILLIGSCSENVTDSNSGRKLQIKIDAAQMGLGVTEQLDFFVLTVTAEDLDAPITGILLLVDGYLIGEVTVPPGKARHFVVEAYEGERVIYRGETTVDIAATAGAYIEINLYPQVPLVKLSPRYLEVPQGSMFGLELRVYNILELNNITVSIIYNNDLLVVQGAELNPALADSAALQYLGDYAGFGFSIYRTNTITPLVDDSGYAYLATVYFQSFIYNQDVMTDSIYIDMLWMYKSNEDSIPTASVVKEGSHVEMYRPTYSTVALWSMNDDSTNNIVYDASDNNLNGTATGTSLELGVYGTARTFNGDGDYVEVPDNNLLDITQEITISMYAKFAGGTFQQTLLSKRVPDGSINYQINMTPTFTSANTIVTFEYGTPPGHVYQVATPLIDNEYHHLAISFKYGDPASALWMIDGQVMQGSWVSGTGTAIPAANAYPLEMGRQLSGNTANYFWGGLDEVSISDTALDSILIGAMRQTITAGYKK